MIKIDKELEAYIARHTSPESGPLYELNRKTYLEVLQPRMISGHIQGKVLEMISCMVKPKYVLEIGTFTGYSAICLSKGLQDGGKLYTLEINDELEGFVQHYFEKAGVHQKIELCIGNALELINGLDIKFDLVFIDADKQEYLEYYQAVVPKLNTGGFILADNVLWDGKVLDKTWQNDPDTKAIMDFNNFILNDGRVENVILPIRDGINLIRKI